MSDHNNELVFTYENGLASLISDATADQNTNKFITT